MARNDTALVRTRVKQILTPQLESMGFIGRFPNFRRLHRHRLELLAVEFDRWGRGFFLEFAALPPGPLTTAWGEVIQEEHLTVAHTPFDARARLQAVGADNSLPEHWFDISSFDARAGETEVRRLVGLLPQVNDWFTHNIRGPNVSVVGDSE